jgi:hypothetical protein
VFLAGFFGLLHRLTQQRDLVIGTPIANRHRLEIEELDRHVREYAGVAHGCHGGTDLPRTTAQGERSVPRCLCAPGHPVREARRRAAPGSQPGRVAPGAGACSTSPILPSPGRSFSICRGLPMKSVEGRRSSISACRSTRMASRKAYLGVQYGPVRSHLRRTLAGGVPSIHGNGHRGASGSRQVGRVTILSGTGTTSDVCVNGMRRTEARRSAKPVFLRNYVRSAGRIGLRMPIAVRVSTGAELSYAELNRRANRLAHHLREQWRRARMWWCRCSSNGLPNCSSVSWRS